MELVYLGLGSNLNHPQHQLNKALQTLANYNGIKLHQVSSFYQTKPLNNANQPDYLNAVAELSCKYQPLELLDILQNIETMQGRIRSDIRWSSRTLDLDLLLFGKRIINHPRLIIPHYQMHLRHFVLQPLYEIAPNLSLPNGQKCKDLLAKL